MSRTVTLIFVAPLLLASSGAAQEPAMQSYRRALYMELGGNSLVYSVNYDQACNDRYTGRVGLGFISDNGDVLAIPTLLANYLFGQGNKRLEVGAGIVGFSDDVSEFDSEIGATFSLAYRYQRPNDMFFKVGFTPILVADSFWPWFGVSVGYAFGGR